MSVSYLEVKKVFDTLPVGYYIGRDVKRELSESENGSYYDPMNDKITISFNNKGNYTYNELKIFTNDFSNYDKDIKNLNRINTSELQYHI